MGQQHIRTGLFGAALALGVVLLLLALHPRVGPLRLAVAALQAQSGAPRLGAAAPAPPEAHSRLADRLNSPLGDIHADLRLMDQVFAAYRGALRTGNPVGENAEITASLTGRNTLGFAFVPPGCPAINAKGELCDRWGTPFFFHQLSGDRMEIRSAGPDRRLWTADDEVLTP